ncbi:MAG: phytoene desaturase [Mucilaginibacter sp.]|nr:phytoene desaturase [Mucilaginibacter sp.]
MSVGSIKDIAVIGAGFAGLSAATYLAKAGCHVEVFEKNADLGGRARQLRTECGYTFDMGPSWYWMPDVFERFFADFGAKPTNFYELKLLDPEFSIVFGKDDVLEIRSGMPDLYNTFEKIEKGSALSLERFLKEAAYKYEVGIGNLVYKPGLSLREFADPALWKGALRLQVFSSLSAHIYKYFKDPRLRALMEFPALFLGARPEETPALYSLMNYACLKLGTWYPMGGFGKVVEGMKLVAEQQGVRFNVEEPVTGFKIINKKIRNVNTLYRSKTVDGVIGAADYHHIEQELLKPEHRHYSSRYWGRRVMAPSALIFYLGVNKKLRKLKHHTLFFDENLDAHSDQIYKHPRWPERPLFYVCCPSKTDASVAPVGHENLFILMPLAINLIDEEQIREQYFNLIMERLETYCGEPIRPNLDYEKSYCVSDFKNDYNSFGGNAYGLANTLLQTAVLKPSIVSRKVRNLFYAGHLTVPGPGIPPAIISGKIAAKQLIKYMDGYEG